MANNISKNLVFKNTPTVSQLKIATFVNNNQESEGKGDANSRGDS